MYLTALVLIAIAGFLWAFEFAFVSILFFAAGIAVAIGTVIHRTGRIAKRKFVGGAKKIYGDVDKAAPSHPSGTVSEGLKILGGKAGDHLFDDDKIWAMGPAPTNMREKVGPASKGFIDKFKSLFQ